MKRTIFLFPGDGIHQKDMLNNLYKADDFFMDFFDSNLSEISGVYSVDVMNDTDRDVIADQMRIVISEIAIASFWRYKGVSPSAVIGHSLGEYAAACFSDVFGIKKCMELIVKRGQVLKHTAGKYGMGAVHSEAENVLSLIDETGYKVEISAVNGKKAVTVSGEKEELKRFLDECSRRNINVNLMSVNGGGHNSILRKYSDVFSEQVSGQRFSEPKIKFISTVDSPGSQKNVAEGKYWVEQMLYPVNMLKAFETDEARNSDCLLDVGVSPALLGMAVEEFKHSEKIFIPSIRAGINYRKQLGNALKLAEKNNLFR